MDTSDDEMRADEVRMHLVERLKILDAFATAVDRRDEVMETVGTAATADDALDQLRARFGFDEVQAVGVLDLQMRRFATDQRRWIAAERDQIRASID